MSAVNADEKGDETPLLEKVAHRSSHLRYLQPSAFICVLPFQLQRALTGAAAIASRDRRHEAVVGGHETPTQDWHYGLLTFSWPPCPPNADCTVNYGQSTSETGRFGPGILTITYARTPARPRTYQRLE